MTLAPLLSAPVVIQVHAVAALAAFVLGLSQFLLPKGDPRHRIVGWAWVLLMAAVSVTAFFIYELRIWGRWSPIHILAVVTLVSLAAAVHAARRGAVDRHRKIMLSLFALALVVTGLFTLMPGRLMHAVVFG